MIKLLTILLSFLLLSSGIINAQTIDEDSVLIDFLYQIQNSIEFNEPAKYNNLIDFDKLSAIIFKDILLPQKEQNEFMSGLTSGAGLGAQLVKSIENDGHYTFMSYAIVNDTIYPFYRLVGKEGLNYHEYVVVKDSGYKIVDMYIFATGEFFSESIRNIIEPLVLSDSSLMSKIYDFGSKLFGDKKNYLKDLNKMNQFREAYLAQKHETANNLYESFGDKLKYQKSVQLMNIQNSYYLGDTVLLKYIDIYRNSFPGDQSLDLMLIDYYLLQEDYDKVFESIANFQKVSTEDAFLETMKAGIYFSINDTSKFISCAQQATEYEPWITEPYYMLIEYYATEKQFVKLVDCLNRLEADAGMYYDEKTMNEMELFSEFIKSEEYKNWKK